MSARIKGLFSSKKKTKRGAKDVFGSDAALASDTSIATKSRAGSVGSTASALEFRDGTLSQGESSLTMTPTTLQAADDTLKQLEAVTPLDASTTVNGGEAQGQGQGAAAAAAAAATDAVTEGLVSASDPQKTSQTASELQESNPDNHATLSYGQEQFVVTAVYHDVDGQEISYYSQRPDGSLVEHRSFISDSQQGSELNANDGDGIYLNSTTEFFPVEDQDEQVYLEEYADEYDEIPTLQVKVSKLQKQVREMRKFMRGMVQLQIEQYEPATIMIQAWWRGCLVRRELRRQMVFSWHKNPRRNVKPLKYLTKAELIQSCARISVPKASILITEDLGAHKETIAIVKLQAAFRSYLVRKRVRAYEDGMDAATLIQACWRGYWTRNLDTRLGLEQLRFRNVKVQKAFTRVSMKLQYLQGRILQLEENGGQINEVQEEIHKDLEDMADQMDALRQDLDQGLKQLDEQVSEEKEQTTIEIRGLTEKIQKLEEELKTLKTSNASMEKQVKSLVAERNSHGDDRSDPDEDDEYEVQYDEDGNRIEKPPKRSKKRSSIHEHQEQHGVAISGSRRLSIARAPVDPSMNGGPMHMVESPVPMPQQLHRGSVGSVHSQGHTRTLSLTSQPPPSPSRTFTGAFSSSYSPTITHASALPEGGGFPNGARPHSIAFGGSNNGTNPPRSLTMDSNQLYRYHPGTNQLIPLSPSAVPTGTGFPGMGGAGAGAGAAAAVDTKKFVTRDDFEYMQAEVDALRLNNDRLEGLVRELTMRLNTLTTGMGQFYPG
ncbi:hypothetical protein BGX34_001669 [Mortierella sp. NVP85]|nr:hypothetical protein BGX34_001669 [Mortierella sp. NVP85]